MSKQPDASRDDQSRVRQAHIPSDLSNLSDLGRDLLNLSREYESSGGELLSEEDIEAELTRRRGGYLRGDNI